MRRIPSPGNFVLVVLATLGVLAWRDRLCGRVGALQVLGMTSRFFLFGQKGWSQGFVMVEDKETNTE